MKKIIIFICFLVIGCSSNKFNLEEKYYKESKIEKISNTELINLENNKESFLIFVNMPFCAASNEFDKVLKEFLNLHKITIYEISFSNIQETKLKTSVKYYPTIVIYKNGKIISLLDPNKKEHYKYYKTSKNLKIWLEKYLNLNN